MFPSLTDRSTICLFDRQLIFYREDFGQEVRVDTVVRSARKPETFTQEFVFRSRPKVSIQ